MGKLKSYQQQLQGIVDKGINAAEEQQKKLSAKPFNYAEKLESELREYSVKTLRQRYYGYSDEVFDQLRSLNSRFSNFAGDLVAKLEREAAQGADAVSEAAGDASKAISKATGEVSEAADEAASEVSGAAQEAKKSAGLKKSAARKTTSTAKNSTASA
ncbi:hypothetical protein CLH62_08335 [Marinobacter guineae]|uniref:Uncharacterized protein n=1 Tax=Marinobacter guineae TaxID=432303 RepID=A0A2G1VG07_9GAMM|nr:hypothetical protein [Marinobacter guineae]PHQ25612.1 hypothetical protein CLH62_08335 [Marinobacter guineae]